jgi:hypothetical protein
MASSRAHALMVQGCSSWQLVPGINRERRGSPQVEALHDSVGKAQNTKIVIPAPEFRHPITSMREPMTKFKGAAEVADHGPSLRTALRPGLQNLILK